MSFNFGHSTISFKTASLKPKVLVISLAFSTSPAANHPTSHLVHNLVLVNACEINSQAYVYHFVRKSVMVKAPLAVDLFKFIVNDADQM